jgi:glycosyltransferase involved in cell wall biosynthesis
VRKKLREIQPDIVHGQGTERECALAAAFSGFPNVVTIHGNMRAIAAVNRVKSFTYNWFAARLESFTLPRTDGVVCITDYTKKAVADLAKKTWIVPNAVDSSFFDIEAIDNPGETPAGICVGAICGRKNQNAFIRSLDALAAQKKFKIVFLGDVDGGDYGREFMQLMETRNWCEYAGFASREKLKGFLRTATFTVLPTVEDNCPMVILEAMAAGVPVMASRVGGIPDLIEAGTTGLFCDPLRPETFAAGVKQLLENPGLCATLAKNAKVSALKRFHPEIIASRHVEIYNEVLGRRAQSA